MNRHCVDYWVDSFDVEGDEVVQINFNADFNMLCFLTVAHECFKTLQVPISKSNECTDIVQSGLHILRIW